MGERSGEVSLCVPSNARWEHGILGGCWVTSRELSALPPAFAGLLGRRARQHMQAAWLGHAPGWQKPEEHCMRWGRASASPPREAVCSCWGQSAGEDRDTFAPSTVGKAVGGEGAGTVPFGSGGEDSQEWV